MKAKIVVIPIALLLVLAVVLFSQIFNVASVEVVREGNITVSAEEIIRESGIQLKTSIFSLSKETVKKNLEGSFSDNSIAVDRVEKVFPNSVRIYVRNRRPILAVPLSEGRGVIPTDRDFQLISIRNEADVDYDSVIRVTGIEVATSFDTDDLVYLRRVIYSFFRIGFDETSLTSFVKEFCFENDRLIATLRTEDSSEFVFSKSETAYDAVINAVGTVYDKFLETSETERGGKSFSESGVVVALELI